MKKGIILQGSSRSVGNTSKIVEVLQQVTGFTVVDLKQKNIGHFDYDFKNQDDDFMPLMRDIADNYEVILFVTPVYWYSMSSIMKAFFDRITDCLKIEKSTGRKLRGKSMGVISSSEDPDIVAGFDMPFRESAGYLGMTYLGHLHTWVENGTVPNEVKAAMLDFFKD